LSVFFLRRDPGLGLRRVFFVFFANGFRLGTNKFYLQSAAGGAMS
jgi:hypothetical protein